MNKRIYITINKEIENKIKEHIDEQGLFKSMNDYIRYLIITDLKGIGNEKSKG